MTATPCLARLVPLCDQTEQCSPANRAMVEIARGPGPGDEAQGDEA